jgi:hypothetical protein
MIFSPFTSFDLFYHQYVLPFLFFLIGFALGLFLISFFVFRSFDNSNFVDCGNGYMVRVPLACPESGLDSHLFAKP